MASLLDNLRAKVGGQLLGTSSEELGSLSAAAGRSAPPTSPLEAGALGANPDSAKMAGSSANRTNALRLSVRAAVDASTQDRQRQDRTQATGAEQAAAKRAGELGQAVGPTGALEDRVAQIAQSLPGAAGQPTSGLAANTDALRAKITDPAQLPRATELAQKLAATGDLAPEELAELARLTGTPVQNPDQLKQALHDLLTTPTADATGKQFAAGVADQITAGQVLSGEQLATAAEALQMSPEELGKLSVEQFGEAVRKFQAGGYHSVADLQRIATDPYASPAERDMARKQLRDLGASGVRTAEAAVDELAGQVQAANTVTVGGQQYTVGQLLSDETLGGVVKRYLEGDDAAKAQIRKDWGDGLANWVDANQNAAADLSAKVDASAVKLSNIEETNRSIGHTDAGDVSDAALKAIYPDYGTTTGKQLAATPLLATLKDANVPAAVRSGIVSGLNQLATLGLTDDVQHLAQLDAAGLAKLGLTTPESWGKFVAVRTAMKQAQELSPETAVQMIFAGHEQEMNDLLTSAASLKAYGRPVPPELAALDADGDGKLDTTDKARRALIDLMGGALASSVGNLQTFGGDLSKLRSPQEIVESLRGQLDGQFSQGGALQKLKGALADGHVTGAEAEQASLSPQEAEDLFNNHRQQLDPEASQVLQQVMVADYRGRMDRMLGGLVPGASYASLMRDLSRTPTSFEDAKALADYLSVFTAHAKEQMAKQGAGTAASDAWLDATIRSAMDQVARAQKYMQSPEGRVSQKMATVAPDFDWTKPIPGYH